MKGLNPTSRYRNIPFDDPKEDLTCLWLLTPEELSAVPTDGSVILENILGESRPWVSLQESNLETRSFRYQGQQIIELTSWGVRLPPLLSGERA